MTNAEKYKQTFMASLGVAREVLPDLTYQSVDSWDSVGNMALIAALEETFNFMMETDDIISFNSFMKGYEILKKYGVGF